MTMGASLAAKKATTVVELSPQTTQAIREQHESIWARASVVEAIGFQ